MHTNPVLAMFDDGAELAKEIHTLVLNSKLRGVAEASIQIGLTMALGEALSHYDPVQQRKLLKDIPRSILAFSRAAFEKRAQQGL